ASERYYGTEHIVARDLVPAAGIHDHRRLDQSLFAYVAAGDDLPARFADPLEDPFTRVVIDHGPDVGLLFRGIADLQRFDLRDELAEELVPLLGHDVDALDRDAALPRERETVGGDLVNCSRRRVGADD